MSERVVLAVLTVSLFAVYLAVLGILAWRVFA